MKRAPMEEKGISRKRGLKEGGKLRLFVSDGKKEGGSQGAGGFFSMKRDGERRNPLSTKRLLSSRDTTSEVARAEDRGFGGGETIRERRKPSP